MVLTAILVDDDYPVARYLSQSISWKELGIELIGCYSNGLEAWENTQQNLPDIVITDIGMPKMNGLEMLEKFNQANPLFRAIILSCHNEFDYAQQAMKLKVSDYILKESLDVDQLQQLLHTISVDLSKEKHRAAEMLMYMQKESLNRSALKEQLLKDTLYQLSWTKEAWLNHAQLNGVELDARYYLPLVIYIDRMSEVSETRKMNDYTISFAVENVLQEVLDSMHRSVIFRHSNGELVALICCDDPVKEQQILHYTAQKAIAAIKQYLKISVTCLLGREASVPEDLRLILMPMLKEWSHRFYLGESQIHRFERATFSSEDMYAEYALFFSKINDSLALNRPEHVNEIVKEWATWVRTNRFHPADVKEWVLQLLMDLQMKTKVTLQVEHSISEQKPYDAINDIHSMEHLQSWIMRCLTELSRRLSVLSIRSKRPEIIRAQKYVIQHVTEKLTLEEMAGYLNLNSSYFSRLFKRETNQNFIEYVNMVKLQKAKQLLQQSNITVEEVSDYLGYANKSYFIKLFKREVGMTPSEFTSWNSPVRREGSKDCGANR
ncbi:response regulator transcription factor [Paenibacillus faecalis]|uniref:response regulator transcription factor n=1 Tax=Paenibacillus faecalis TaxID=2079532 RepID=UPI001F29CD0B|nr:helix-turn-helix domain-containing protein [Paenibacillus faecalis]